MHRASQEEATMSHTIPKSSARKKLVAAAVGVTALTPSAAVLLGIGDAGAAPSVQSWIQMCIRNGTWRSGTTTSPTSMS